MLEGVRTFLTLVVTLAAGLVLAGSPPKGAPQKAPPVTPDPVKLELLDGQPQRSGDYTLKARAMMYAHLSTRDGGSDNESRCMLEVSRAGQSKELSLDRLHSSPPEFVEALGLEVALEGTDPYHQPSRAWVLVRPAKR